MRSSRTYGPLKTDLHERPVQRSQVFSRYSARSSSSSRPISALSASCEVRSGSIAARGSDVVWQVLPFILAGLLLAMVNAPALNALSLGEDVARGLGQNIAITRAVGVAAVTLLSGASVAACGALAFVGLIVPHLVRPLSGTDHRWLLPYSGLVGAVLLLVADVLGRVVAPPGELEVGVVLALIGAPFFIALVRRRKPVRL